METSFDDSAWDRLVLLDDLSTEQGYDQGEQERNKKNKREGFLLGLKKGAELGTEIGSIQRFAHLWLGRLRNKDEEDLAKTDAKAMKILEKLESDCDKFPSDNIKTDPHLDKLLTIRAKFKLAKQILKLKQEEDEEEEEEEEAKQRSKEITW